VTAPTTAVVTGVAGFIGSHLAERLVADGHRVVGVDCFRDYYPRATKEANLARLRDGSGFTFVEADLATADCESLLGDADYVFHQAAQAGVRASWGDTFATYVRDNIAVTQRLLEAARRASRLRAFVFASSSSVYGDAETMPTPEETVPRPVSPYGVTKLACEHLCRVYHRSFDVPTVALRYFTVYGPRQRPDMALQRFCTAFVRGDGISIYGDGEQTRDFTFVSDAVEANIRATAAAAAGQIFNIGGGSTISIRRVIDVLRRLSGKSVPVSYSAAEKGDARHTAADIHKAKTILGFAPTVDITEGLRRQLEWVQGGAR
jgi:nucleoside-diphosphate-sugar epimerase